MPVLNLKSYTTDTRALTHPIALVESDGTPEHTRVRLLTSDGTEIDITSLCRRVEKKAGDPVFTIELYAVAPRQHLHGLDDEYDRELHVAVA